MFEILVGENGHVQMAGRLDAAESEKAHQTLSELSQPLVIDCSRLDYISSAGIGVLIETYKRLHASGHTLRLVQLLPRVRNVFAYAGLDQIFTLE
jgi:anti-anti-sigma factor